MKIKGKLFYQTICLNYKLTMNSFYLLWVNIEYFGSISTSYSYKSTWIHFSSMLKKRIKFVHTF